MDDISGSLKNYYKDNDPQTANYVYKSNGKLPIDEIKTLVTHFENLGWIVALELSDLKTINSTMSGARYSMYDDSSNFKDEYDGKDGTQFKLEFRAFPEGV